MSPTLHAVRREALNDGQPRPCGEKRSVDEQDRRLGHQGAGRRLAVSVVAGVVTREPALQRGVGVLAAICIDLVGARRIAGELEQHSVWILGVERTAVTVFEDVGSLGLPIGLLQTLKDRILRLFRDVERDVTERRWREIRIELILVRLVGELEERKRTSIGHSKEAVAVHADRTKQLVGLGPRGHERQPDEILVEGASRLEILGQICGVVQTKWCGGAHVLSPSELTVGHRLTVRHSDTLPHCVH